MVEWCDNCGHEIGRGTRLGFETTDGRLLCGVCRENGEVVD